MPCAAWLRCKLQRNTQLLHGTPPTMRVVLGLGVPGRSQGRVVARLGRCVGSTLICETKSAALCPTTMYKSTSRRLRAALGLQPQAEALSLTKYATCERNARSRRLLCISFTRQRPPIPIPNGRKTD